MQEAPLWGWMLGVVVVCFVLYLVFYIFVQNFHNLKEGEIKLPFNVSFRWKTVESGPNDKEKSPNANFDQSLIADESIDLDNSESLKINESLRRMDWHTQFLLGSDQGLRIDLSTQVLML